MAENREEMFGSLGTVAVVNQQIKLCRAANMKVEKKGDTVTITNEGETVFRAMKKSVDIWLCLYNKKYWLKPTISKDTDVP